MKPPEPEASQETVRTDWSSAYSVAGVTAGTASGVTTDAYISASAPSNQSDQASTPPASERLRSGRGRDPGLAHVTSGMRTAPQAARTSSSFGGRHYPLSTRPTFVAEKLNKRAAENVEPSRKPPPGDLATPSPANLVSRSPLIMLCFVLATVTALWAMVLTSGVMKRESRRVDHPPFCCPDEASYLARYVDGSVQPCADFASYVCARGFRGVDEDRPFNVHEVVERDLILGTTLHRDEYAMFLGQLFRSCLRTLGHPRPLAEELAVGLTETAGLKQVMTAGDILNYFLHVSLKFSTESLLVFEIPRGDLPYIKLIPYDIQLNESQRELFGFALDAVVDKFNAKFNTSVSSAHVIALDSKLRGEYSAQFEFEKLRIDRIGDLVPSYTSERWVKDVTRLGWPDVANVIELHVRDRVQVAAIFKTLLSTEHWPAVFAYLLAYTVACAYSSFDIRWEIMPPSSVSSACLHNSVTKLHSTWQLTYARIFASPERTARVNATFRSVLEAVVADVSDSDLNALEKSQALSILMGVTLVPPPREVIIPGASNVLPTSEHFGLAYYLGLEHEFLLTRALTLLELPHYIDQRRPATMLDFRVIPSPIFYPYLDYDSPTASAVVSNMPVMGTSFAQLLWAAVEKSFLKRSGGSKAFSKLHECASFRDNDRSDANDTSVSSAPNANDTASVGGRPFDIVPLLALKSVLRAMGVPQASWHERRLSWSDWNLSHAQFFYDRHLFFTCFFGDTREPPVIMEDANAVLAYVRDFAQAFSCSESSPMMKKQACFV